MGNLQVSVGAGGFNAEEHGLAAWVYPQQPHSAYQSNEKGGNGQKICTTFLSSMPSKRAQSLSRSGFRKTQGPLTVEDGSNVFQPGLRASGPLGPLLGRLRLGFRGAPVVTGG